MSARFLLDRSLGQRLIVERLRAAGWDARTLAEEFGDLEAQRMPDEEWITQGAAAGYFLLAKDHRIAARALEAQSIYYAEARVVVFARGDLTAETMSDLLIRHRDDIDRLATVAAPFVFSLSPNGLNRKRLNAP